jgi:outer membrane immunogenic protein
MRRLAAAATAAAVIISPVSAPAAEFPVKAPSAAIVTDDWSGFYIGGDVGYGWQPITVANRIDLVTGVLSPPLHYLAQGGFGGVQMGYNFIVRSALLAGLEFDLSAANIRTTAVSSSGGIVISDLHKIDWFGTARGRLGWTFKNVLIYGTTGLAWFSGNEIRTQVEGTVNNAPPGTVEPTPFLRAGWTAGTGIEYRLTHNWSIKTEYLYLSSSDPITTRHALALTTTRSNLDIDVVRGGVSYKF